MIKETKQLYVYVVDKESVPFDRIPAQIGMQSAGKDKFTIIKICPKTLQVKWLFDNGYGQPIPMTNYVTTIHITKTEAKKFGWKEKCK